ncbi:sensor histidine kinase [Spirillospora sp. CA-294931]|uniref:sensor histidine kinase n=1 Tax=Spirillospora sp. CA-294931 TaxID=3240042 RepID=UPI003D921CDD
MLRFLVFAPDQVPQEITLMSRTLPAPLLISTLILFPDGRTSSRLERSTLAVTLMLPLSLYLDYLTLDRSAFEPCLSCVSMGRSATASMTSVTAHLHTAVAALLLTVILVRRWTRSPHRELVPARALGIAIAVHIGVESLLTYLLPLPVTRPLRLPYNATGVGLQILLAVTVAVGMLHLWLARTTTDRDLLRLTADVQVQNARHRLQRDLHDGAQLRLVNAVLAVQLARGQLQSTAAPEIRQHLDTAAGELQQALEELRKLARGGRPGPLQQGLEEALRQLAAATPVPVTVEGRPDADLPASLATTVYYLVSEAVTNAVRHARADGITVGLETRDEVLRVTVADDGIGNADPNGTGLLGLAERVSAVGGRFVVSSPAGGGTVIIAEMPCVSSSQTTRS